MPLLPVRKPAAACMCTLGPRRCSETLRRCAQVDIQDKDTEIVIKADTPGLTGADLTVRPDCDCSEDRV